MKPQFGKIPQERIVSVLPSRIAGVALLVFIVVGSVANTPETAVLIRGILTAYGIVGTLYALLIHYIQERVPRKRNLAFLNASLAGFGVGMLIFLIPHEFHLAVHGLPIIYSISMVIISGRKPAYLFLWITSAIHIFHIAQRGFPPAEWVTQTGITIIAVITVEAIQQSKIIARGQVSNLEAVNKISRQMVSTLDTQVLMKLLDGELKRLFPADTYFIGLQKDDNLRMELFYDDGQYFNDIEFDMEGTLSKWVIVNESPLFLPDLREAVKLEGVKVAVAGKEKTSLSWMGVPMKGSHVKGLIAIASYRPDAFTRGDLELLSNIAQLVTFALDNSFHHAQVEEQARLDSLTRVYNHGFFIHTLRSQAQACLLMQQPLSLIMLDVDHFKQYNDSYGHLAGDRILVHLCDIIRAHIKKQDAVGRWGGEEFAISLPNSNSAQAHQVARRIQESLANFALEINNKSIPAPTVSIGISIFPTETQDIVELIDLADKRLYAAKERGRDQIEAAPV